MALFWADLGSTPLPLVDTVSYFLCFGALGATSTAIAPAYLPDWGEGAEIAFQTIFPHLVVLLLLQDIERLRGLALSQGINIQISRCNI